MICLRPTRIMLQTNQVSEASLQVKGKAEENVVVYVHSLFRFVNNIQRWKIPINNSNRAFFGCI